MVVSAAGRRPWRQLIILLRKRSPELLNSPVGRAEAWAAWRRAAARGTVGPKRRAEHLIAALAGVGGSGRGSREHLGRSPSRSSGRARTERSSGNEASDLPCAAERRRPVACASAQELSNCRKAGRPSRFFMVVLFYDILRVAKRLEKELCVFCWGAHKIKQSIVSEDKPVRARIREDGRVLLAAQQPGLIWEFPGGKLRMANGPSGACARSSTRSLACVLLIPSPVFVDRLPTSMPTCAFTSAVRATSSARRFKGTQYFGFYAANECTLGVSSTRTF